MPPSPPPQFQPPDADYRARVAASFGRQRVMQTCGIELARVAPGEVELRLPYREALTQQHGFLHAGVVTTALDSACGYAAFSLMPAGAAVLTVEFKVNLLAPAKGARFTFTGRVIKPGRTLTIAHGEAHAWPDDGEVDDGGIGGDGNAGVGDGDDGAGDGNAGADDGDDGAGDTEPRHPRASLSGGDNDSEVDNKIDNPAPKLIAHMTATLMTITDRPGVRG